MSKLTPKQDAFVKEYILNGGNATQAALKAGYSEKTANEQGCQNLTKLNIKEAIAKHQKKGEQSFIWSKETKLAKLEKMMEVALQSDAEKGMINMPSFVAALKVHNEMQGDNAPTETNNTHTIKSFNDMYN